ncbi:MAG: DoxX family protein [Bacteroidota bacterium]
MKDILDLLARICIACIFIYEAYDLTAFMKDNKLKMTEYGLTWNQDLLIIAAIVLLYVGGILLLIGYKTSLGALLLLAYWVPLTFIVHSFWNDPEDIKRIQSILFMKNVAIIGGLIMVLVNGSGRFSVKRLMAGFRVPKV